MSIRIFLARVAFGAATAVVSGTISGAALAAPVTPASPAQPGTGIVEAQSRGAEYFQVSGVAYNDRLNIRSGPSTGYRVVAQVSNGQRLRNLGCRDFGPARWCEVEIPGYNVSGWAAARYLTPVGGGGGYRPGGGRPGGNQPEYIGTPEVRQLWNRNIEVSFRRGCDLLYSPYGRRMSQSRDCSARHVDAAEDAVRRYLREQDSAGRPGGGKPGGGNGGGGSGGKPGDTATGASVSVLGRGEVGRYRMTSAMKGSRGDYVLTLTNGDLICNARFSKDPTKTPVQVFPIGCTDGDKGQVTLTQQAGGYTATFNISGNKIGTITMR